MLQKNILSYSRDELSDVLRIVKEYRTSLKQIGRRATLSDSKHKRPKIFRIEYTSVASPDFVRDFASGAIRRYFADAPLDTEQRFIVNDAIVGGIRIFYGDDMVDLSFQDFARMV